MHIHHWTQIAFNVVSPDYNRSVNITPFTYASSHFRTSFFRNCMKQSFYTNILVLI